VSTSIRAKESYGASLRLGYIVSPGALLYTRFGFQRTRFQVNSDVSSNNLTVPVINQSKSFNGFRFGLGAELSLTQMFPTANLGNTFLRLDWSATWYQKKSFFSSNSVSAPVGPSSLFASHSLDVKPMENKFVLGLGLRF